jgi:hypothetical protein
MVEMDLIQVGSNQFLPEFVSLTAQERNSEACENGDQRLGNPIRTAANRHLRRLHFTERGRDDEQSMRITAHEPESIDKHGPLRGERVDEIGKVFALDHAMVLQSRDGIISQPERPSFDSGKPPCKAREIKRILLASIDHDDRAWRFELSATALSAYGCFGSAHNPASFRSANRVSDVA